MYDDDIDRNGIPDAIQRDPVVVPPEPVPFSVLDPDPGLPGITAPISVLGSTVEQTLKSIGDGVSSIARK